MRKSNLLVKEVVYLFVMTAVIMALAVFLMKLSFEQLEIFFWNIGYYKPFTLNTSDPTVRRIVLILETFFYLNTCYHFVVAVSFLIGVICLVLAREFEECIAEVRKVMTKEKLLSDEAFQNMADKFYELATLVREVDEMFSIFMLLNLTISMGTLCGATFSLLRVFDDTHIRMWTIPVSISILNLLCMLPPAFALHSEVRCEQTGSTCVPSL